MLVFANKQDLPNAMQVSEISEKLGLVNIRNRKVSHIDIVPMNTDLVYSVVFSLSVTCIEDEVLVIRIEWCLHVQFVFVFVHVCVCLFLNSMFNLNAVVYLRNGPCLAYVY